MEMPCTVSRARLAASVCPCLARGWRVGHPVPQYGTKYPMTWEDRVLDPEKVGVEFRSEMVYRECPVNPVFN